MLLVGFDSAWTRRKRGALVAVTRTKSGSYQELAEPCEVDFDEATAAVARWRRTERDQRTLVLLDQPTIVSNESGQRPVENLVSSPVSRRYGGMQPANTSRDDMFGPDAPIWPFLRSVGGPGNPLSPTADSQVFETYPVLALIALGWTLPDRRSCGRLPKYNPERRKTFSIQDWRFVCTRLVSELGSRGLSRLARWVNNVAVLDTPRKKHQDGLDACICLLVAIALADGEPCLMVGNTLTGFIVVPRDDDLCAELADRCRRTGRDPSTHVRRFRWKRRPT